MMSQRPRRNRKTANLRDLIQESWLQITDFVYPMFVTEEDQIIPIASMSGQNRWPLKKLSDEIRQIEDLGIRGVALFPAIHESKKNPYATESTNPEGLMALAIQQVKKTAPSLVVFGDVAMDPYSSDGHDGIVKNGEILNDETLEVLAQMALVQAQAGVDFIAPSDMMDGRVGFLRRHLDEHGRSNTGILAYSAKYASSFYGPFREALDSAPKFGDKKTYQMNPANRVEALREVSLDISEGADIVMVKPALAYLDIIREVKNRVQVPVAAYNVSGEYAMIKAAAEKGWIDEKAVTLETLTAIKRAGADIILSYHAKQAAEWLK